MNAQVATDPWLLALEEAVEAYRQGSVPVGAVIVSTEGEVLARGRNRLSEPRTVQHFIAGNDLAHAEINALLALTQTQRPAVYGHTLYTTVEPCPQCLGAFVMSPVRHLAFAALDPWAGCTELLTSHPYFRRKSLMVTRAPTWVQEASALLLLVSIFEDGKALTSPLIEVFREHMPDVVNRAWQLFQDQAVQNVILETSSVDRVLQTLLGPAPRTARS
jgi:tRNA(adenine34) deaminase